MTVVERGQGTPLVLVPGIQGRWEYMRPAIDALAEHFHVLTFPLSGEPASGPGYDPSKGLDNFADQIETVLGDRGLPSAVICGVSFGGLVALRFAATRPALTSALVLVSTPEPGWHLRRRHDLYARLPWLFGPVFLAEAPWRLRDELRAAFPAAADRRRFTRVQLRTFLEAPLSVSRMATRARLIEKADAANECRRIATPTLIITGEPGLDHVLAAEGASEYGIRIAGARVAVLGGTGHLGMVTKPRHFALTIKTFVDDLVNGDSHEREPRTSGAPQETKHDAA